ncbi:serine/arginine-rich splicing factor 3b [Dunckerocampus dactyliophorus]|uniref:serine/arginine-rich splicing factor 3b n=1 Tax=Dunckerocampus dactyliophorus TaxID=161453 RepID=UPI00240540F2|nr:serine/arginine-rich splicing factor 3b [Dunckerocampus dactyliophorus]
MRPRHNIAPPSARELGFRSHHHAIFHRRAEKGTLQLKTRRRYCAPKYNKYDPAMHRECPLDCKVYVGNLGNNGNKTELERAFSYYGPLRSVWVARNPPGFAFVEFEDPRDASDAVRELDGRTLCGCRVRVELSNGEKRSRTRGAPPSWSRRPRDRDDYRRRSSPPPRRRSPRRRSFSRSRSRSFSRDRRRERSLSRDRNHKPSRSFSRSRSRSRSNDRK